MGKSFYDFDYIIDLNEQRLMQYSSTYREEMGRLTTIILIYSAMAFFSLPIIREVLYGATKNSLMIVTFLMYLVLFSVSVFYTVRFIIPVELNFVQAPKYYYGTVRKQYESLIEGREMIERLLKGKYIFELEKILDLNEGIINKKRSFYKYALLFGLLSALPYLVCVGFYFSNPKNFQEAKYVPVGNNIY